MSDMGDRIRRLREEKDMSQEHLGKLVGVQRSAVNKWENGTTTNLRRDVIHKLAQIFGVSGSYLLGLSETRNTLPTKTKRVPMLGHIAAGEPILAEDSGASYAEVDCDMVVDFCLQVKGDSMKDARILDGDLVFVRKQPIVENGEIAVVLIDEEATLKRFYYTNKGVILKSENPAYQPMFYGPDDFKEVRVLGKAVLMQTKL